MKLTGYFFFSNHLIASEYPLLLETFNTLLKLKLILRQRRSLKSYHHANILLGREGDQILGLIQQSSHKSPSKLQFILPASSEHPIKCTLCPIISGVLRKHYKPNPFGPADSTPLPPQSLSSFFPTLPDFSPGSPPLTWFP